MTQKTDLGTLIEDLTALVIITEPDDIPGLGHMLKLLAKIDKYQITPLPILCSCIRSHVEKLVLEEEKDIKYLEKAIKILQTTFEKLKSGNERINPEQLMGDLKELGCEELIPFIENEMIEPVQKAEQKDIVEKEEYIPPAEDIQLYMDFAVESLENLENAEVDLISLESDSEDSSLINSIFRAFHTIKGVSGFLDLPEINSLAHKTETLLDKIRQNEITPEPEIIDTLLTSMDFMKQMISDIKKDIDEKQSIPSNFMDISTFLDQLELKISPEQKKPIGEILIDSGKISKMDIETSLKDQKIHPEKKLGEILVEQNKVSKGDLSKALRKQRKIKEAHHQIKVDTLKLDSLVDLTGELVIAQSILKEQIRLTGSLDNKLIQSISHMNQIISSVQKISMSMRMVPIGQTFQKMIRVVRDVSSNLNKKVELLMEGKDTEIDRNMVDALYEPLVHMIRNSVDHGVELPAERQKKGKIETGSIVLSSYHRAGHIVIEISDDGQGLDKEILFKKGVEKGLISSDAKMSDKEIFELIFHPGFSTNEEVTDVSGRGVGMDVVKDAIEKLKGGLDINSEKDAGTKFTIRLPLTMAIIDGMLVRVDTERYVIPTMSILEAIPFDSNNYFTLEGQGEMVKARGNMIPLIRLNKIAGIRTNSSDRKDQLVLVVEHKGSKCGIVLDELIGKDEFVIKSLGELFHSTSIFSGGAILGDGQVGLIVDMSGLFKWTEQ